VHIKNSERANTVCNVISTEVVTEYRLEITICLEHFGLHLKYLKILAYISM